MTSKITWPMVEAAMPTFTPTSGGYSIAKRGIVTFSTGESVFIKLPTEETTAQFITKEIAAYKWLRTKGYSYTPNLLLSGEQGIVLPDLSMLDWSDSWNEDKLKLTFKAIDELSGIKLNDSDYKALSEVNILNGWQALADSPEYLQKLLQKLEEHQKLKTYISENLRTLASEAESYLSNDAEFVVIHADVRADNLAYDAANHKIYLVDWNWMGLGPKAIEDVAILVNAAHDGFDVEKYYSNRLDPVAATVLAGFWFYHSTRRIWEGGNPALRDLQFRNALQASKWIKFI